MMVCQVALNTLCRGIEGKLASSTRMQSQAEAKEHQNLMVLTLSSPDFTIPFLLMYLSSFESSINITVCQELH